MSRKSVHKHSIPSQEASIASSFNSPQALYFGSIENETCEWTPVNIWPKPDTGIKVHKSKNPSGITLQNPAELLIQKIERLDSAVSNNEDNKHCEVVKSQYNNEKASHISIKSIDIGTEHSLTHLVKKSINIARNSGRVQNYQNTHDCTLKQPVCSESCESHVKPHACTKKTLQCTDSCITHVEKNHQCSCMKKHPELFKKYLSSEENLE